MTRTFFRGRNLQTPKEKTTFEPAFICVIISHLKLKHECYLNKYN